MSLAEIGFTESKVLHQLHQVLKPYLYFFTVLSDLEFNIVLCSVAKINEVVYSIGWTHEVSGFENPCDSCLVKSVVEGARRQLSRPCTQLT
jgi:hypothetical protein